MQALPGALTRFHDAPSSKTGARKSRAQQAHEEWQRFNRARRAEQAYARALRKIAAQIDAIVRGVGPQDTTALQAALRRYGEVLRPWASRAALVMLEDVSRRDEQVWYDRARDMGRDLRAEIKDASIGGVLRQLMDQQVHLITSLPKDAAQRVHELSVGALYQGDRPREIVAEIMKTGQVTRSRANLIARTETGRASTALTEARALHVGSEGYIWRTAKDADVRRLHKKLEGKFFRWDDPPVTGENGERSHPGSIYNCRCWPEVVVPDEI